MKNFIFLLSLCIGITMLVSCNKDDSLELEKQETDIEYSTSGDEFNYDVEVSNNILSFNSFEEFKEALAKLSDVENGYYTSEAIENWQERIGFESMGVQYQTAMDKFENVDSDAAYDQFVLDHPEILMSDDIEVDAVVLPVAHIQLAYLLNKEGKIIIGENLHLFTDKHQIIVLGKEEDKLNLALENLESNDALGIYVLPYILDEAVMSIDESAASVRSGSCGISYDGQQQSGSRKVVSEIRLIATASPRGFFNGGGWDYFVDAKFKGKSERKNWRGHWRTHSTWMDYFHHYSVCATVNGSTSNPDREYHHYPSYPTSGYTYTQRLVSGFSMFNAPPTMNAAFNFWIHRVKNRHDNITLDRWCF